MVTPTSATGVDFSILISLPASMLVAEGAITVASIRICDSVLVNVLSTAVSTTFGNEKGVGVGF